MYNVKNEPTVCSNMSYEGRSEEAQTICHREMNNHSSHESKRSQSSRYNYCNLQQHL